MAEAVRARPKTKKKTKVKKTKDFVKEEKKVADEEDKGHFMSSHGLYQRQGSEEEKGIKEANLAEQPLKDADEHNQRIKESDSEQSVGSDETDLKREGIGIESVETKEILDYKDDRDLSDKVTTELSEEKNKPLCDSKEEADTEIKEIAVENPADIVENMIRSRCSQEEDGSVIQANQIIESSNEIIETIKHDNREADLIEAGSLYPDISSLAISDFNYENISHQQVDIKERGHEEIDDIQNEEIMGMQSAVQSEADGQLTAGDQSEIENEHIKQDMSQSETAKIIEDVVEVDNPGKTEFEAEVVVTEAQVMSTSLPELQTLDDASFGDVESLGEPVEIVAVPEDTEETLQESEVSGPQTQESQEETIPKVPLQDNEPEGAIKPFTEKQLKSLYYNAELEGLESYVDDFLKHVNQDKTEFYELVLNYYRARNNLVNAEQDVETLRGDCDRYLDMVWTTNQSSVTVTGKCSDQYKVSKEHTFDITTYDEQSQNDLSRTLKTLRSYVHEELSLYAYSAQLSRLQVESYIHELYKDSPSLQDIPQNAPVRAWLPEQRDESISQQVEALQVCIKVLFMFQRKPTRDDTFVKDTRQWLRRLVASLLRVATLEDHLFMLNELLRCPAGVGKWGADLLQIVPPPSAQGQTSWGNPILDHCIAMLGNLLLPIKKRDELLYQLRTVMNNHEDRPSDTPWILVDSDGEEDEDPVNSWQYLQENDVVAFLAQFPMDAIFRHILFIHQENDIDYYDIQQTTEAGMLKLFAFASCVITILGKGLENFCLGRYRQLNKRLGKMIRQLVNFVSDHWENMQRAHCEMPGTASMLFRLQVEYDQVFCRATTTILAAQRLGSWQFLANMPFSHVSLDMMWKLVWLMHYGYKDKVDIKSNISIQDIKDMLEDAEHKAEFEDKLLTVPTSEAIYLLTTLANMARSRRTADCIFVQAIAVDIYEIAYISSHTREFCSKVGRELLSTIAQEHPFVMSILLQKVRSTMDKVGLVSLYLFQDLPLAIWRPTEADYDLLKLWLLEHDLASPENQLARHVLEKLNWSHSKQETTLFLDISLHRKMAVLLVETYTRHLANKNVASYLTESMKQVASVMRNQLTHEQQLSNWAWELALRLSLHAHAHPRPPPASPTTGISHPDVPDLNDNPIYYPIVRALKDNNSLASYLALVMSRYGHNVGDFCAEGLLLLGRLVEQHHYVPAVRALSYITPLFYHCSQYINTNNRFQQMLQSVLYADQARKSMSILSWDFPGPITKLFAAMIQNQLQHQCQPGGPGGATVVNFWLGMLTKLTRWNQDRCVLYVMDYLLKAAFRVPEAQEVVYQFFYSHCRSLMKGPREHGVISSIVSWIATGNNLPSLIETQSCAEFSWFAMAVLSAEEEYEDETGLGAAVQRELFVNPAITVEQALKKALTTLKMDVTPAPNRLSLYRWAHQALDMELGHPLLPIMWQKFFRAYLGRLSADPGLPQRGSVGEKYFESTANVSLLKRMKKRLAETADFHHKAALEAELDRAEIDEAMDETDEGALMVTENMEPNLQRDFHRKLVKLYNTMSFWLDEPRLHDPQLYLPALPQQYEPERLLALFQNEKVLWVDHINIEMAEHEIGMLLLEWTTHLQQGAPRDDRTASPLHAAQLQGSATERILSRLKVVESPKPPPALCPLKAPVAEVNASILHDKQTVLYALRADFNIITEFARLFSLRVSKHVATDCAFLELLPSLYKNEMTEVVVTIPCTSSFNPTHRCKGPACVTIRYEAKSKNEIAGRKADENRAENKQLMIESLLPPPQNVCSSVVHVENTITSLIRLVKMTSSITIKASLIDVGTALFYHLSTLVSEDTRYYPPTRQFFSACIEILGKEFILFNPAQSQPLLQAILKTPTLVGLLAPNFSPNASPDLFVTMYEDMINVPTNQGVEVAFTLLSKFDVKQWLEVSKPALSQRSALVEVIGNALGICGPDPDSKFRMVFDESSTSPDVLVSVYRSHLEHLFLHRFPDHYGDVLKLVLKGSANGNLSCEVWDDFLKFLGCPVGDPEAQEVKEGDPQMAPKVFPSVPHMRETMEWMSSYFFRLRVCNTDSASFGLYPKWRPYVAQLSTFLGYLTHNTIEQMALVVRSGDMPAQQMVLDLWQQVMDVFAPWIQPLDNNGQILSPWVQNDCDLAAEMVVMFVDALRELHANFEGALGNPCRNVLGLLWPYYATTLAKRGTPEHVLTVYHKHLLSLPWSHFHPDSNALDLMQQVQETQARSCFVFLSEIFTMMNWPQVLDFAGNHEVLTRLHICLFDLLTKMAKEHDIIENTQLGGLVAQAGNFNWSFLDGGSYESSVHWYLENGDARSVLAERTAKKALILGLMKIAAGFKSPDLAVLHPETPVKRVSYTRCVVQLLCRCSHLKDVDPPVFGVIMSNILTEIETTVGTVLDPAGQHQEAISLCSEVLNFLNNCNPTSPSVSVVLTTLMEWVQSSPNSLLLLPLVTAACRTLASVTHMSLIIEACIDAHFNAEDPNGEIDGWGWVLGAVQVPELTQKEFLEACIQQGSYLTLFTHTLQRLPLSQGLQDEAPHLDNLIQWTTMIKPTRENEGKLFLWWAKVVELMLRYLHYGGDIRVVITGLNTFVPALFKLAEDKSSQGLLGAVGLGKKSALSQRFRLVTRTLATFLLCQVPSGGYIRMEPHAPAAVRGAGSPRSPATTPTSPGIPPKGPTQHASHAMSQMESLRKNKQYESLKEFISWAVDFTANPEKNIKDTPQLILHMVGQLFFEKKYLGILLSSQNTRSS